MRKNIIIVIYISLAVALSAMESAILPTNIIPGTKLGLANLVVVISIYQFGVKESWLISFMRVLIVSLVLGSFLTPTFMISVSGMIFSLLALTISFKTNKFSAIGVSILASVFHIIGQVIAVAIIINISSIIKVAPFLIYIAVITGFVIGYLARRILKIIKINSEVIYDF